VGGSGEVTVLGRLAALSLQRGGEVTAAEERQAAKLLNRHSQPTNIRQLPLLGNVGKLVQQLNNENDQEIRRSQGVEFGADQEGYAGLVDVVPRSDASPLHSMKC
jgi:hypothetical protein